MGAPKVAPPSTEKRACAPPTRTRVPSGETQSAIEYHPSAPRLAGVETLVAAHAAPVFWMRQSSPPLALTSAIPQAGHAGSGRDFHAVGAGQVQSCPGLALVVGPGERPARHRAGGRVDVGLLAQERLVAVVGVEAHVVHAPRRGQARHAGRVEERAVDEGPGKAVVRGAQQPLVRGGQQDVRVGGTHREAVHVVPRAVRRGGPRVGAREPGPRFAAVGRAQDSRAAHGVDVRLAGGGVERALAGARVHRARHRRVVHQAGDRHVGQEVVDRLPERGGTGAAPDAAGHAARQEAVGDRRVRVRRRARARRRWPARSPPRRRARRPRP